MTVDRKRAEAAMAEFLRALGHDGEDLRDTPARVTEAYADDLLSGYAVDVPSLISQGSEALEGRVDPVLLGPIEVSAVCPHHLLVARGTALLAYEPGARILGLGTLSKLVAAYSRRLVLQEKIASQVVDALMEHAGARGAFCRITLSHTCLQARGARETGAEAISWAARGTLKDLSLLEVVLGRPLPASEGSSTSRSGDDEDDREVLG